MKTAETAILPWQRSNTMRALFVAGVAQVLGATGIGQAIGGEVLPLLLDRLFDVVALGATAFAAWARARQPTPPLSKIAAHGLRNWLRQNTAETSEAVET